MEDGAKPLGHPGCPVCAFKQCLLHPDHAFRNTFMSGSLGGSAVEHLPLAQGMILEFRNRVPRRAPCMEPASPSALSLSLCLMNKEKRKKAEL